MKKMNKKWITLMLAGAVCSATLGTALIKTEVKSSAEDVTYALTDIFSGTDNAAISAKKVGSDTAETTAFTFTDGEMVRIKRSLAFKWYEGKDNVKYLTIKFAFEDLNFTSMSFVVESTSAWATEDEKATNTVQFTNESGKIYASVLNGKDTEPKDGKKETAIVAGTEITLALAAGNEDGEFAVKLNDAEIGSFTNVGANSSTYTYDEMHPLEIEAKLADTTTKTTLLLDEINGQRFDNVTSKENSTAKLVTDTAAPVLVVNEEINGFLLGAAFSLNYEKIDVLQSSSLSEAKKYYQYDPTDTEWKVETSLSSSVYFMDTTYYVNAAGNKVNTIPAGEEANYKATSVYEVEKQEYAAIEITLGDNAHNTAETKKVYDLSWYASSSALAEKKLGENARDFIILNRSEQGATYKIVTANTTTAVNDKSADYDTQVNAYQAELEKAAADVYAGSNSYIYFPSVEWLFKDDNGYRNLKFTISYKSPSADSAKTSSSLSYNSLKLAASDEGLYEVKLFANDKAGNTMKYYLDGELVEVTSSNVWDIEEIPSFIFEIENRGLKVEEPTKVNGKKDKEILDETYTFSDATIIGASNEKSDYALFKLDRSVYNSTLTASQKQITDSVLTGITYTALQAEVKTRLADKTDADVVNKKYLEVYKKAYASLVAKAVEGDVTKVLACFTEVKEYNSLITEEDETAWKNSDNKYNWKPDSKSFKTIEEGEFMIFADYWEAELPMQRAVAYKLIVVDSEADSIKGDSNWLKNNLVSVILFSIAGVMLILIIILLLIKPSEETLEDVDEKAAKKKEKNEKKDKE